MSFDQTAQVGFQQVGASQVGAGQSSGIYPTLIASAESFGTAFLQSDTITPALVTSGESFGTQEVGQQISLDPESEIIPSAEQFFGPQLYLRLEIDPSAIASAEAFNAPGFSGSIGPDLIPSEEYFYKPTLVLATLTGQPGSVYRFYINDVLVNDYILRHRKPVSITHEMGSYGSCRMTWYDPTGTQRPEQDQEVIILDTSTDNLRIFGGLISKTVEQFYTGLTAMEIDITATGWGAYLERRVAHQVYPTLPAYTDDFSILYQIVLGTQGYGGAVQIYEGTLDGTGITIGWPDGLPYTDIGEQEIYCQKVSQALRVVLADKDWWVDPYKVLRVFSIDYAYENAPFGFADDDGNFLTMKVIRDTSLRANRIYVKNSRPMKSLWTDEYVGEQFGVGETAFPTSYILNDKPRIFVDDVEQVVAELSDYGSTPGWQWYYVDGGAIVQQNWADSPLTSGNTLRIVYPSPLQYVYVASDQTSIDADGLWEAIVEGKDLAGYAEMAALGDAELARRKENIVTMEATTRRSGLFPSQLISVACTHPLLSDSLVIKSVNGNMVDGKYILWTVRAITSNLQKPDTWNKYVANLIDRDRQPVPRGRFSIHIILAGDVQGSTNPGLVATVVPGARTAERSGYIREWRMGWEDGAPFSADLSFDIYQNAVSIFPSTKPTYPAGSTGVVKGFTFASDNIEVAVGDKFTAESLSADATAMNGWIDLIIEG